MNSTTNYNLCPECNSDDLDAGRLDVDTSNATGSFDVICNTCGFTWYEVWKFSHNLDQNGEEL